MIYVEIKASKTKNGVELSGQLPPELANSASLEIFALRDGMFLLSIKGALEKKKGEQAPQEAAKSLSDKEKDVIRKLLSIRFEKRIPSEVNRMLSREEKEILDGLVKKRMLWVFFGDKYGKEGVYNISDSAFAEVREQPSAPETAHQLPINSPAHLEKMGWMVLENETEARNFGNEFSEKVKNGAFRGLRAFDKKYYFIAKGFAEQMEQRIMMALSKGDKTSEELSSEIGVPPEGCRALLIHLAEAGEVLEKQKGKYAKA